MVAISVDVEEVTYSVEIDMLPASGTYPMASTFYVVDAGDYYTGSDVETVLQEVGSTLASVNGASGVHSFDGIIGTGSMVMSGANHSQGRILTLDNTSLTKDDGLAIYKGGLFIHPSLITTSHLSSSSTITFTSVACHDGELLTVIYYDA